MSKLTMNSEKYRCFSYYDAEANVYDEKRFSCECREIYDRISKTIINDYLRNCRRIVDAGTGTGRFAIHLAKNGKEVIAMDISEEMLSVAREKAKLEGCENKIHFVVGDIENMPFKSGVFDGVCSIFVLIHFASREKIISEFSRIVRNEGIIVFDVPDNIITNLHWRIMKALGKTTFRDYHYGIQEINKLFTINLIKIIERKKFIKFPAYCLHFLICVLRLKIMIKVVYLLEMYNFGATSLIKGIQKK